MLYRLTSGLIAFFAILTLSHAQAPREDTGYWYRTYEIANLDRSFEINVDVIQIGQARTGIANISVFAFPGNACPAQMNRKLCSELRASSGERGYATPEVTGARIVKGPIMDDLLIAFRLPSDRRDRLMVISQQATYHAVQIYHPDRGLDYYGLMRTRQHVCERTMCSDDVFAEARSKQRDYGSLATTGWAERLRAGGGNGGVNNAPTPPKPRLPAEGDQNMMSDLWGIYDFGGKPIGAIRFRPGNTGLAAEGEFLGFFNTGRPSRADFQVSGQTREAVAFRLTVYAGESGERQSAWLLAELPSHARGAPRGTLIRDDGTATLVTFDPAGPGYDYGGQASPEADDLSADPFEWEKNPYAQVDPDDEADNPAIGIYRHAYRLRGVPAGKRISLRATPSRQAAKAGSLSADAGGFQLNGCMPEIGSLEYEEASFQEKLQMLSSSWCQVQLESAVGWLPGIYLEPILR